MTVTDENITYSDQQRESLVKKYKIEGFNIREAAILTNIEYETAKKIIQVYNKENRIEKKKRGRATKQKNDARNRRICRVINRGKQPDHTR